MVSGGFDVLLSPGAIPVSRLDGDTPVVIWADATFASLIEHYGLAKKMPRETICAGHATERAAYRRASLLIFASQWAADSAVADYGVDRSKIAVVPFGANFIDAPAGASVVEHIQSRPDDRCELISIGVDWIRKGMPRAVALAAALNAAGLPTRLTIVGCKPPDGHPLPVYVEIAGFIDKRTLDGEKVLGHLLARSHFHVLFSIAEAFGVVFAEANAYGVPNIAADVGGIESAVVNGRGGQRFAQHADISTIVDYVSSLLGDRASYQRAALEARGEFEQRLNWSVSGAEAARRIVAACKLGARTGHNQTGTLT